jgi:hypothetical protein
MIARAVALRCCVESSAGIVTIPLVALIGVAVALVELFRRAAISSTARRNTSSTIKMAIRAGRVLMSQPQHHNVRWLLRFLLVPQDCIQQSAIKP